MVQYANGTIGYMSLAFGHDNDISDCPIGRRVVQGEVFCQNGDYGNASGVHSHVTVIAGKYTDDPGFKQVSTGRYTFANAIRPEEALFITENTNVIDTKGIVFKKLGSPLIIYVDNGQVTGAQSGALIPTGNTVTLTATPLSGYTFDSWYITDRNTITLDSSNPYTFTMPDHEISIEASFKINTTSPVKKWKNISASSSGYSLNMSATLEIDVATVLGIESPHIVTNPRIMVSTSQNLGDAYTKFYDTPQAERSDINGGKRHRYSFSLNNVSELVNDSGQSLQLQPATVYYYRWMAVINNNLYTSDLYSFTTQSPLVTWSDLCTNGGKYNGLFNGVVRWDRSLTMQEVGCFVSADRSAVQAATRQDKKGCAYGNDTDILTDSDVCTSSQLGTWVFYSEGKFTSQMSFVGGTTYYYKFYACTSDGVTTDSYIGEYRPGSSQASDITAPTITSASVSNVSSHGYDVNVVATDNVGVTKIRIGTWHDNMNIGNAVWQETTSINNGSATIHVSISDFDNAQNVIYHTNVYAYDAAGNYNVNGVRAGDPYVQKPSYSVYMIYEYEDSLPDYVTIVYTAGDHVQLPYDELTGEKDKYQFDHWEIESESAQVELSDPYDETATFTMPNGDVHLKKVYKLKPVVEEYVNLTISASGYGGVWLTIWNPYTSINIDPNTTQTIALSKSSTFDIQATGPLLAHPHHQFDHWETTGSWFGDTSEAVHQGIYPPDTDTALRAVFKPTPYLPVESQTLCLPKGLTTIEAEAFSGVKAKYFILPDSVTSIGANAFPEGSYVYLKAENIPGLSKDVITNSGVFIESDWSNHTNEAFAQSLKNTPYEYLSTSEQSQIPGDYQYRYRTIERTTSTQQLSGWQLDYSEPGEWGSWVSNGTTPVTASEDVDVSSTYHPEQTGVTGYHYIRYYYRNSSGGINYTWSQSYAYSFSESGMHETTTTVAGRLGLYKVYNGYQSYGVDYNFWFFEEPVTGVISPAYTEYQYRTRTRTYYLYRWTDWSDWQDEPIEENDNIEVEIREI